jgi:hypothetical protein
MAEQLSFSVPFENIRTYTLLKDNIILACYPPQLLFARLHQNNVENLFNVSLNDLGCLHKALETAQTEMLKTIEKTEKCTEVEIKSYDSTSAVLVLKTQNSATGFEVVICLRNNCISSFEYKMTNLTELSKLSLAIASQLPYICLLRSTPLENALHLFVRYLTKNEDFKHESVHLNMVPFNVLSGKAERIELITIIKCNFILIFEMALFYKFARF